MTEPVNIGPPRDTMAAEDCEFALRLYLMNQPGWPPPPKPGTGGRCTLWWPTLKARLWMRQFEDNNHGTRNGADQSQRTET